MNTGMQNLGNGGEAKGGSPADNEDRPAQTIRGDETGRDTTRAESNLDDETSTRTRSGAIPSSYGAGGGTTTPDDAFDEGS